MTRNNFINQNEQLIIRWEIMESQGIEGLETRIYETAADVFTEIDQVFGNVIQIIRLDLETLDGTDVTEDIAAACIEKYYQGGCEIDALDGAAPWLAGSEAFFAFRNKEPDRSDYEEHNTMNKGGQGV